ncbi:MAG: ribonuclease HII [Patescibacteria group bacterium]|mgnify:CR=1 FL=1
MKRFVVGIDEVGRGPIAGPVTVGAVLLPLEQSEWRLWEGLKDSKKLSEKKRNEWYMHIKQQSIACAVSFISAHDIDVRGIAVAARDAARGALDQLYADPSTAKVLLDWGLRVGAEWEQEQFVKGDERFPVIALASIFAKVERDTYMKKLAEKIPGYGFEQHKGYGTTAHYAALAKMGPSREHRTTFL